MAPKVSAARTAKPSIVERANVGRSLGERDVFGEDAVEGSRGRRRARSRCAAESCARRVRSASGGVRTLNSSRWVAMCRRQVMSATWPLVMRTRSGGSIANTEFGVPAAAHTSSYCEQVSST